MVTKYQKYLPVYSEYSKSFSSIIDLRPTPTDTLYVFITIYPLFPDLIDFDFDKITGDAGPSIKMISDDYS